MGEKITIRPVTAENFQMCAKLMPGEGQKRFVASNLATIAEAYVDPTLTPYAIYADDEVVGMLAVEYIAENESYDRHWVPRFMIGEEFQGQGYGKKAMQKIIEKLSAHEDCERVRLSVMPENTGAIHFYKSIGFMETDEQIEGEIVMDYFLKKGEKIL